VRKWAWLPLLLIGTVITGVGCVIPVVIARVAVPPAIPAVPPARTGSGEPVSFSHEDHMVLSVAECALYAGEARSLQIHGLYILYGQDNGRWPAAFIVSSAFASLCLVAAARRSAALAACVVLALSIGWLFAEVGLPLVKGHAPSAGWAAYPPLSTAPVVAEDLLRNSWPAWVALASGALLLAAAAWLRDKPAMTVGGGGGRRGWRRLSE
jgi:hypothetical protein